MGEVLGPSCARILSLHHAGSRRGERAPRLHPHSPLLCLSSRARRTLQAISHGMGACCPRLPEASSDAQRKLKKKASIVYQERPDQRIRPISQKGTLDRGERGRVKKGTTTARVTLARPVDD